MLIRKAKKESGRAAMCRDGEKRKRDEFSRMQQTTQRKVHTCGMANHTL